MGSTLNDIEKKVQAGERLSFDDGVRLFKTDDLFTLGRLANHVREKKNGNVAYYVRNMHLNYSNVCVFDCHFCSFYRKDGGEGAWEMDLDTIYGYAAKSKFEKLNEIHIVGGVHPKLPWKYYLEMLRGLKARYPDLHIKAFTATEIDHFTKIAKKNAEQVLAELREAGLDSLPGGGAEIFADRVWNQVCSGKARPERWLEIHRIWHRMGGGRPRPCSTATSRRPRNASTTCSGFASFRTRPGASPPSSPSRFRSTTTPSGACRR